MSDLSKDTDAPDPAEFDLDQWLSGVVPTGKGFTIYQRGDLYDQYQDACDQYDMLNGETDTDETVPAEAPLGAKDEKTSLLEQITALERQLKPGAIHGKVRSANFDDQAQCRRKATRRNDDGAKELDPDGFYLQMAARVVLFPKLDAAGWRKLSLAIGERQWQVVRDAIDEACVQSKGLDLDFSSRRSARR